MHACLWWWGNTREGVWVQGPATDQAADLTTAWMFWRALAHGHLGSFASAWMHASPVHTPLVPLASAFVMGIAGPSRIAAEAVLPVATAVWLIATYAVVARLYDRETARWTAALASAFPVFLIYSRTYLFEHPLAAVFACACWALVGTDGFARTGPSIAFGALAGLTALTRGGGAVFLIGPVAVALAAGARGDWPGRARHAALALAIAAVVAATWYLPNLATFTAYVYRATYGTDAVLRTGGSSALSLANARYYAVWLLAQGPGVPMAALALIASTLAISSSRTVPRGTDLAMAAAFTIDVVVLLAAVQHERARYFQPLMPIVALAIVRAVTSVPQPIARRAIGVAVGVLALHHVAALSALTGPARPAPRDPYVADVPLWNHLTYLNSVLDYYGEREARTDFHVPDTIDRLAGLGLPHDAVIATLETPHPFYQPNALRLEAVRRGCEWKFLWSDPIDPANPAAAARVVTSANPDVVLLRTGGPKGADERAVVASLPALFDPARRRYDPAGRLGLGDGSVVTVFRRRNAENRSSHGPFCGRPSIHHERIARAAPAALIPLEEGPIRRRIKGNIRTVRVE
jgi:4-amino-4-deoxy-L-arabinose transferase-like glycosyltransferase